MVWCMHASLRLRSRYVPASAMCFSTNTCLYSSANDTSSISVCIRLCQCLALSHYLCSALFTFRTTFCSHLFVCTAVRLLHKTTSSIVAIWWNERRTGNEIEGTFSLFIQQNRFLCCYGFASPLLVIIIIIIIKLFNLAADGLRLEPGVQVNGSWGQSL